MPRRTYPNSHRDIRHTLILCWLRIALLTQRMRLDARWNWILTTPTRTTCLVQRTYAEAMRQLPNAQENQVCAGHEGGKTSLNVHAARVQLQSLLRPLNFQHASLCIRYTVSGVR